MQRFGKIRKNILFLLKILLNAEYYSAKMVKYGNVR